MRHPFSNRLLALAHGEPSQTQIAACVALQLWGLLPAAQAEANAVRDGDSRCTFPYWSQR